MFSPVPMRQMRVVIMERDKRTVLQGLGKLGVMHLTHHSPGDKEEGSLLQPVDRTVERERCRALLARINDLRTHLAIPQETGDAAVPADVPATAEAPAIGQIEAQIAQYETTLASMDERQRVSQTRRGQLETVIEQLSSFKDIALPFESLDSFSFLHFAIGSLPGTQWDALEDRLPENVVLVPLPRAGDRRALMAVTSRTGRFALYTALRQSGFQPETVPASSGTPAAMLLAQSREEQQRLEESLRQVQLARVGLASSLASPLAHFERVLTAEQRMLEAEEQLPRTQLTALVTGWVPEDQAGSLTAQIREWTGGRCVVETTPADEIPPEQVPVLLRHSRLLRPFGMLVAGYGLPGYQEIKPTLFVALSYMLMFGMMFGDVGHGAVLMLVGILAIARGRSTKVKDVGTLLTLVGFSSAVFGVIYGSFFGLEWFHKYGLWHDPLEGNPLALMAAAIGMGVLIISMGLILNIANRIRRRDWVGAFLDSYGIVGAIFYWGVLYLLVRYASLRERGMLGLVIVLVIILPIIGWSLREPLWYALRRRKAGGGEKEKGGFFEAAMESVVEAFEAMLSYMANTISFVRLAAYAMSHAAVLMATFVMAREVEKIPTGGGFLRVLVIIGGNLIAIVLEGIIAGVQALRLEYYEFFSKFFTGSGEAYTPFSLADKPKGGE